MARNFQRKNKLAVISDLNVTPLIDLAFSLLIIFMITTPVIEQYNRVDLPDQSSTIRQPPPPVDDKYITIDAQGAFFWGKNPVALPELKQRLDQLSTLGASVPTIHIRGDRSLPYQSNRCGKSLKRKKPSKLSLDTQLVR